MDADRRLTFDGFSLDLANEQLLCEDEVVALTPKAFAVLRRLIEHGGQLVTKEELLRAGWANTHVSDGVLKVSILEIRRALGDDAAAPRFIETVPRRGYRFIATRTRPIAARAASARVPLRRSGHRQDVGARRVPRARRARSGPAYRARRVPRALRGSRGVSPGARCPRPAPPRARRRPCAPCPRNSRTDVAPPASVAARGRSGGGAPGSPRGYQGAHVARDGRSPRGPDGGDTARLGAGGSSLERLFDAGPPRDARTTPGTGAPS